MYGICNLVVVCLAMASQTTGAHPAPLRQRSATTMRAVAPTITPRLSHSSNAVSRAGKDTFDFDVRSDQIVLMMDGLADVAARIAETRDPNFHKKEEDDGPPFKCHCKCSLLGGCECWCGDKDEKSKAGNRNRRRHH